MKGDECLTQDQFNSITSLTPYSSTNEDSRNAFWVKETDSSSSYQRLPNGAPLLHFLYGQDQNVEEKVLYVDTLGADIGTCGWMDLPCTSLHYSIDRLASPSQITTLQLNEGLHAFEQDATTIQSDLLVTGYSLTQDNEYTTQKKLSALAPLLTITSSQAAVTLSFVQFTGTEILLQPLIDASAGMLILKAVSFSTITLASTSLLKISTTANYFSMSSDAIPCTFTDIIRNQGSGAVFDIECPSSGCINICNAQFIRCYSVDPAAVTGSVYIYATGKPAKFDLMNLQFSQSAYGGGSNIRNVYISCADATEFLTQPLNGEVTRLACFTGTIEQYDISADINTLYEVVETTTSRQPLTASLYHFLYDPSNDTTQTSVYLSGVNTQTEQSEGVEVDSCGWSDVPCLRITTALKHRGSMTVITLTGGKHESEEETITLSYLMTFTGQGIDSTIKTVSDMSGSDACFVISDSVTFEKLSFALPSSLSIPLISAASGSLKLTSLSFAPNSDLTSLTNTALIQLKGNKTTTTLQAVISQCTITGLTSCSSPSGNGGAVYIKTDSDSSLFEVKYVTFTSCSAVNGGGMWIDMTESSSLTITHSTFHSCTASEYGGAIYISLSSIPSSLT